MNRHDSASLSTEFVSLLSSLLPKSENPLVRRTIMNITSKTIGSFEDLAIFS